MRARLPGFGISGFRAFPLSSRSHSFLDRAAYLFDRYASYAPAPGTKAAGISNPLPPQKLVRRLTICCFAQAAILKQLRY